MMARNNPDNFINCSSKLLALDRLLPFLKANGSRPLMFSQSTKMLTLLEAYCDIRGHKYVRLDGSTPQSVREFVMARYNHPESDIFMFLISTRAGGLGLNLQTSDTVIFHESDWYAFN
jgi:SNF2 family DNA or RNA helicase